MEVIVNEKQALTNSLRCQRFWVLINRVCISHSLHFLACFGKFKVALQILDVKEQLRFALMWAKLRQLKRSHIHTHSCRERSDLSGTRIGGGARKSAGTQHIHPEPFTKISTFKPFRKKARCRGRSYGNEPLLYAFSEFAMVEDTEVEDIQHNIKCPQDR